jgi:hypothetical protein
MQPHRIRRVVASWLPVAAGLTMLAFAGYGAVQQSLRGTADDPQLELARDAAMALDGGAVPSSVLQGATVDVSTSLAPWVVVYDAQGAPVASTATFQGNPPIVPDAARADAANGELTFTWQPRSDLRFATVVEPFTNGTVVAGRSLQEVEIREQRTLEIVALGWLAALGAAFVGSVAAVSLLDRTPSPH